MSDTERWLAGLGLPAVLGGVTLLANGKPYGWRIVIFGAALIGTAGYLWSARRRAARLADAPVVSVAEMVRWLRDRADYGTRDIQNARDVQTVGDVERRLRPRHERWVNEVKSGVNRHCLDSEAQLIEFLDRWDPHKLGGLSDEHVHLRDMACERVKRMRALAGRLERGETSLKA